MSSFKLSKMELMLKTPINQTKTDNISHINLSIKPILLFAVLSLSILIVV